MATTLEQLFTIPFPSVFQRGGLEQMPMDVYSTGESYVLTADLPGVTPDKVDVDVNGQVLTIRAQRTVENVENAKWIVRERTSHTFVRQFNLGDNIDNENITATFDNGVLTVTTPLSPKAQPRKIQVTAGASGGDVTVDSSEQSSPEA